MLKTRICPSSELVALALLVASFVAVAHCGVYNLVSNAYLCISPAFTTRYPQVSGETLCGCLCDENPSCQAFTLVDGPCQLFVFDSCSKSVRNCSCFRTGLVYVKQQSGLQPGALCPSGYTDDLCGVKYKIYNATGNWAASRQKCESENGLVIMADVLDTAELNLVDLLYNRVNIGSYWVGGYQRPGSAEPTGGWHWVACNISVATFVWGGSEPDNLYPDENAMGRWHSHTKLSDFGENSGTPKGVLCECVSPFD